MDLETLTERKRNSKKNVNNYDVRYGAQLELKEQLKGMVCKKSIITLIISLLTSLMPLVSF